MSPKLTTKDRKFLPSAQASDRIPIGPDWAAKPGTRALGWRADADEHMTFCETFRTAWSQAGPPAPAAHADLYAVDLLSEDALVQIWTQLSGALQRTIASVALQSKLAELEKRVARLEQSAGSVVSIRTFAPEPYVVVQPIDALIQKEEGQYIASFLEADIHASGDTEAEALSDLKAMALDAYDALLEQKAEALGPLLLRQRAVLLASIRKRQ